MSLEENKALIRRFLDEGYNKRNLTIADELLSPNLVISFFGSVLKGPEGWKKLANVFLTAFPDIYVTIEETIAEGDKVVANWSCSGTHKGPLRGIAPTGKEVTWKGIAIYRIADNKIVEAEGLNDALSIMQQIGAIPSTE